MAGRTTLKLTDKDKAYLKKITRSRSKEARVVSRAKILLHKAEGYTIDEIAQLMKIHRNTVILCLKKFTEGGIEYALNDKPRKSVGRGHGITQEGRDWVISIATKEPQYAGLLDPSWSYEGLTSYISKNAVKAGFPELESISKTSVRRILASADNSTLKIRRNDMSQHLHDGDVQLSIPIDDFLSAPAQDWPGHEPGEQLSMSMLFDLYSTGSGSAEEELLEEIPEEEDLPEDEDIAEEEDIEESEPSLLDEDLESALEAEPADGDIAAEAIITDDAADEPAADDVMADESVEDESAAETAAEPAYAAVPEDAPETAPVEDMPEDNSAES